MPSAVLWIALALALVMIAVGARDLDPRRPQGGAPRVGAAGDDGRRAARELDATLARLNERAPGLQRNADRLSASQVRLSGALEALAVTRRAAGEARSPLRWYQSLLRP